MAEAQAEAANSWIGHRVDELDGTSVARVTGLYVDSAAGEPVWVVAKLGRFGRVVAIPYRDCAAAVGHVWAPFTRDDLRAAPPVDPEKPLSREQEIAICTHYAIGPGQGRHAEVLPRSEGEITAESVS